MTGKGIFGIRRPYGRRIFSVAPQDPEASPGGGGVWGPGGLRPPGLPNQTQRGAAHGPRPPAFVRAMRARRPPGDASLCHGPLQIIIEGPMDQGIARLGRVDAVRGDQIPIVVLIQKIGAHVHHREPAA